MQRFTDGTPCPPYFAGYPPQYPQHHFSAPFQNPYAQSYALPTMYEDTADIQYTTELQQQLRKAKPRRRVSLAPSARGSIAIHEDATSTTVRGKNSKAAGPADTTHDSDTMNRSQSHSKRQSIAAQPRRRRVSAILADRLAATDAQPSQPDVQDASQGTKHSKSALKKEARRRTIYIPDDTTVFTIHPGGSVADSTRGHRREDSPDTGFDLVTLSEEDEQPLKTAMAEPVVREKKAPRKSLAVPPKKAPLQQSKRPLQSVSFAEDVMGAPSGKENVPPGGGHKSKTKRSMDDLAKARLKIGGLKTTPEQATTVQKGKMPSILDQVKSPKKRTGSDSILAYSPKPTKVKTSKGASTATMKASATVKNTLSMDPRVSARTHVAQPLDDISPVAPPAPRRSTMRGRDQMPFLVQKAQEQACKYSVLSEDLAHPELYEDHWLEYQEVALSQLLNNLFEPHHSYREPTNQGELRKQLLSLYHDPQIPLLHKRLQASLLYGALSIPKDLLAKASRIKDDIGLKKKFLTLFTETYDLTALRAAAEVIIGREVPKPRRSGPLAGSGTNTHSRSGSNSSIEIDPKRLSAGSTSSDTTDRQQRAERRSIERFLDAFLIKHEDAVRIKGTIASIARSNEQKYDDYGSQGWAWRRTVLRSFMLILLLDKAKKNNVVDGCLFQGSSPHKSSAAVLTSLGGFLLPSLGDLGRPLSHLNYTLEAVQYPLQEYTYHIDNLAVDLRDGVILTRVAELVLFKNSSMASAFCNTSDQTMTFSMPTGELLTSTWINNPSEEWILSQHLKFPCAGRPQKIYNVQIAICALSTLGGAAAKAASGITADDIVDGHREKTLSLLWALVGHCGLATMVDWQELKREIRHFRSMVKDRGNNDITAGFLDHNSKTINAISSDTAPQTLKQCSKMLLAWAQAIAALRGIEVTNLTTSFASPRVLEAIVDAYTPYFPSPTSTSTSSTSTAPQSFSSKLKSLNCSAAFISLFTPSPNATTQHQIPSATLTLSTLAYLSTLFLPLVHLHRRALQIQTWYRHRLLQRRVSQRIALARLAHICATVVRARERVVGAAVVLQRAWRRVLDKRIEGLVRDVVGLQARARGWLVRERVRAKIGGGKGRKERRVRGGW